MAAGATLRLPAALAAAVLTALIVYASLFPFEGWVWPAGRNPADLLALPWPRARIPFDLWSNYLGYLPLGLLIVLALWRPGRSLLAVGVRGVVGEFKLGDMVSCRNREGREVARGLVNYNAAETRRIMGLASGEIEGVLGYLRDEELIHRDNLVLV